jgi:ribulose kinase
MSVRAAFAPGSSIWGELLAHATREITLFRSAGSVVEQSSREIWQAVCYCIKTAVASAGSRRHRLPGSASMPPARWW